MDINLFSKILRELILEHDRVSLPGMGSFIAEMAPSVFSDRALVIHPPFRRILFRTSEIWNDGLLEGRYATERGVSEDVAKHEISEFIKRLKIDLNTNKSYKIPEFGSMRATEQNDYFFVADKELFNYIEGFGLEPINIRILSKRGEVEKLSGKPMERFFKGIPKDLLGVNKGTDIESIIEEAGSEEFNPIIGDHAEVEELPVQSSEPEVEEIKDDLLAIDEDIVKPAQEPVLETRTPEIVISEPEQVNPASEPVIPASEPVISASESVTPEPLPVNPAQAPKQETPMQQRTPVAPQSIPPVSQYVQPVVNEKSGKSFVRKVVTTLIIIFLLLALIVVIYIFRDQFKPILEWILYSKEERELLKAL
ncbi:MAG: hypothetical protein AB9922_09415 [Bacteroidales bacterium]